MNWERFKYSKNQVKKAANLLIKNDIDLEERIEAFKILANFRSSHEYPTQSMVMYFRRKAHEVDKNAIIVRRLKRMPSILAKLKREKTMKVDTMGDIGGIRIIVEDIDKVRQLARLIRQGQTKNKIISEKDYIKHPKTSGYRSIHFTYSYQGDKADYKGYKVELQIRSQIQHAWATAVEVIGTYNQESLKSSEGNKEWLDFFKITSKAFICLENKERLSGELKRNLTQSIDHLNVLYIMRSFLVVAHVSKENKGYFLLRLDIRKKEISVQHYETQFLEAVQQDYRRIEMEISDDNTKDVVFVSTQSIKDLKKAYPNYFADTNLFLKNLKKVIH